MGSISQSDNKILQYPIRGEYFALQNWNRLFSLFCFEYKYGGQFNGHRVCQRLVNLFYIICTICFYFNTIHAMAKFKALNKIVKVLVFTLITEPLYQILENYYSNELKNLFPRKYIVTSKIKRLWCSSIQHSFLLFCVIIKLWKIQLIHLIIWSHRCRGC